MALFLIPSLPCSLINNQHLKSKGQLNMVATHSTTPMKSWNKLLQKRSVLVVSTNSH